MPRSIDRSQLNANVVIRTDTEQGQYLKACARQRNVSMTRLAQILVDRIADDQLAEAVLDDAGQHDRAKHERRFKEVV